MKNIIVPVITFLIGAFVMHVWERYKSRVNLLNYEVWHQPLGLTAEDIRFGSVKVLYNEQPVNNLYMSTIYVRNESNKDIADIKLNIACDVNSIILVSYGRNLSSLNELSFTSEYQGRLISGNPGLDLYQKRDYLIPVINRGDTIVFTLLTSNTNAIHQQPILSLGTDYPGLRMNFAKPVQLLFGESQSSSALLGIIATLLVCVPIIYYIPNKAIAVIVAACFALFAALIGVLIRKLVKQILKLLS